MNDELSNMRVIKKDLKTFDEYRCMICEIGKYTNIQDMIGQKNPLSSKEK